ncbi:tRNA-intron endonuclease catalytic domain-like protein [Basidiobolus meristosporus CBS 931.73]|uniref:tRNA-intron lyase n=1 Tax=Basidiobolus meristosporus CBS 931.73 TaxID=1314790 RepID=A0A1Y1Z8N8_9FUNG|nr:tRNA-intron endonuclease catalytic domain-like protein [Basidiobolus meristosporus CBS 931.73]|eukprot:ORY06628.1 tRNA-intron endonuclease catalytic domain-like protein [Basidiobolus meristosporus CBS 931.73]
MEQLSAPWDQRRLPLEMHSDHIEDLEYLQLSPEESMFLREIEAIDLIDQTENPYSMEECWNRLKGKNGDRPDNEFVVNYAVYHYYRSRGWVVKNGVKYGTDYVLYRKGPVFHHSEYAVIIVPVDSAGRHIRRRPTSPSWQWLLGVNRVCGQVKKTILLCYVFVPDLDATQLATPQCIRRFRLAEHQLKRWLPERNRD